MTGPLPLGRGFRAEECGSAGAAGVTVISHRFWQGRFGGDPAVVGKTLVLNGHTFTIIGVAAPGFQGAHILSADIWAPLSIQAQWVPNRNFVADDNLSWLEVTGRLKPVSSLAEARAQLAVIALYWIRSRRAGSQPSGWIRQRQ